MASQLSLPNTIDGETPPIVNYHLIYSANLLPGTSPFVGTSLP
jgi:hypothetical protein